VAGRALGPILGRPAQGRRGGVAGTPGARVHRHCERVRPNVETFDPYFNIVTP
jgi:hypothetical protein